MNGHAKDCTINRLGGPSRRPRAQAGRPLPPAKFGAFAPALDAAGDDIKSQDLMEWAYTPARIPWLERTEYQYRLGRHKLILATCEVASGHETAIGRAEAEFALVVDLPGHRRVLPTLKLFVALPSRRVLCRDQSRSISDGES